ncbi:FecR family protein [Pseudoflavitalea rhizosphaerae]|uniref:FecR family protein n=1 Tax=Pseudoflavitalea rhizosphaerae TaxID=1884793 RepID=UPI000F8E29E9|nr:FecR domain-containing protein [Pseudoflavitalea rhizosphaerae]
MSMSEQQYANWGVAEFMADPAFQDWVSGTGDTVALLAHWKKVQQRYPELQSVMEEAAGLIRELRPKKILQDPEGERLVWKAIREVMKSEKSQPATSSAKLIRWPAVAAVVLMMLGVAALVIWLHHTQHAGNAQVSETTDNRGAFRLISLPDSSKVMLGANSNIRYNEKWNSKKKREVWLKGDAHFEVKHFNRNESAINDNEKFLVHVNDQLEIEVLGTVFNVWNRNGKTEVELESGKVKLRMKGSAKEMLLKPGEVATINGSSLQLNQEKSDLVLQGPDHDKLYNLNNTSVAEIIDLITKTYGKKVMVDDTTLLSRKIDGVLPLCHEKDLLFALSGILDIRVRQTDARTWVFSTAE